MKEWFLARGYSENVVNEQIIKVFFFFFFFVVTYLIAQEDICDGDIIKVCDDVIN